MIRDMVNMSKKQQTQRDENVHVHSISGINQSEWGDVISVFP